MFRMTRALLVAALVVLSGATWSLVAQVQDVPVTPLIERSAARAGSALRGALRVELPPDLHIQANQPRDASLIPTTVSFASPPGVTVREVVFPDTVNFEILGFDGPQAVFEHIVDIGVEFAIDRSAAPGLFTIPARFRYQACDDRQCFAPRTVNTSWSFEVLAATAALPARQHDAVFRPIRFGRGVPAPTFAPEPPKMVAVVPQNNDDLLKLFDEFDVLGTGAYMTKTEFLTLVANAEAGVKPQGVLEGQGLLAILAIVFVGGLALNLTPCVLPMIPINLAIIGAGAHSGTRGRGFLLGSAYGAAMAFVYGVLGLVVILTAGTFGSINASPWFNVALAMLFVVLALAMFDIVNIDFSRFSSKVQFRQESRGSIGLAFGMGAVAALLAGACVAPVVIQVVVFASERYGAGVPMALALPFVLGLGMALPWPIAGAGMSALPRPGAWMVRVKQAMGVFILATAVYYGYVAYEGFANRWVDPGSVSAGVESQIKAGWRPSLAEGLAEAKRDNKLVLLDFWATWCKNCLVMDKTTLVEPEVMAAVSGYVRIKVQTEDPDAAPNKELLKRIGAVGLPAYAILRHR